MENLNAANVRRKNRITAALIIASCLLAYLGLVFFLSKASERSPVPEIRIQQSPETREKRWAFIKELVREGIFSKVENAGSSERPVPTVWVGAKFYALDFEQKETFMSVVFAYYFEGIGRDAAVHILDRRSGKKVGSFSNYRGFQMD